MLGLCPVHGAVISARWPSVYESRARFLHTYLLSIASAARDAKAVKAFPRPTAGPLRPIVHGQTLRYQQKRRSGRGFTHEELKVLPRAYSPSITAVGAGGPYKLDTRPGYRGLHPALCWASVAAYVRRWTLSVSPVIRQCSLMSRGIWLLLLFFT